MPKTTLPMGFNDSSTQLNNTIQFLPLYGPVSPYAAEADAQCVVRASLTLKNLMFSCPSNAIPLNSTPSSSTLSSRKNGSAGSLAVSVPNQVTGFFSDTTDSDALTSGDKVDYQLTTGGNLNSLTFTVVAATLDSVGPGLNILGNANSLANSVLNPGSSLFAAVSGALQFPGTELPAEYVFRHSASWQNMDVRVNANNLTGASTVTSRVGGAAGNQSVSIPGGASGNFSDTTDADSLVSGSAADYSISVGTDGANTITIPKIQAEFYDSATTDFSSVAGWDSGQSLSEGRTFISGLGGDISTTATAANENRVQLQVKMYDAAARNLFIRVTTNNSVMPWTFRTRNNGANGSMAATVPKASTGTFEDLTDGDVFNINDLVNFQFASASSIITAKNALVSIMAAQLYLLSGQQTRSAMSTRINGMNGPSL